MMRIKASSAAIWQPAADKNNDINDNIVTGTP